MSWFLIMFAVISLTFGFVVFFGAPYLPTLSPQVKVALDLLDLKKGETMLELGSGDGKVLLAAAQRGWKAVGYELNPVLVLYSRVRTRRYRKNIVIIWGNYWTKDWPACEGIFTFMLDRFMKKLDNKIEDLPNKPIKLASFAFKIPNKQPLKTKNGVLLYEYS